MTDELQDRLRREAAEFLNSRLDEPFHCRRLETITRTLLGAEIVSSLPKPGFRIDMKIREKLHLALKRERGRAKAGSIRYSFSRHLALHQLQRALGLQMDD